MKKALPKERLSAAIGPKPDLNSKLTLALAKH